MDKKGLAPLLALTLLIMLGMALLVGERDVYSFQDQSILPERPELFHSATSASDLLRTGHVGTYGAAALTNQERTNSPPDFQAKEVSRSAPVINLNPGKSITFWVDFLNTGKRTWYNSGNNFFAVNVTNPPGRTSPFRHSFWKKPYQPAKLLQTRVRPGEVGRFRFALQAPLEPGIYREHFNLVAENLTWIDGGYFEIIIGAGQKIYAPPDYQAEAVGKSTNTLKIDPAKAATFWIDFKNTGLKTWYQKDTNFLAVNVTNPTGRHSFFQHQYWKAYYRPGRLMQERVYPGEIGRFKFALQAPTTVGYYTEAFHLVAENHSFIPGGFFEIPITVGEPYIPPKVEPIVNEPSIRIGLFKTNDSVTVTANGIYAVQDSANTTIATKQASEITTITLFNTALTVATGDTVLEDSVIRLVPATQDTIMQITSFENRPSWNSDLNDNTFRGAIEVRYVARTNEVWVINELPLESYLRGLAEVSNEQPAEYLKALIIAARSYALWHKVHGGKHPVESFDINATTDQVYRSYGFEQRSIDPLQAVVETQGMVITHSDAISESNPQGIALAPYSSGTDGRTRSWSEVWAGEYSWIISVDDPYGIIENALTLEGNHMVGMSAKGARGYATEESKTYDWILKHYYTGVAIEKLY